MNTINVQKGDQIWVPDKQKAQFGDSISGGLATVLLVKKLSDATYITTEETGKIQWHLDKLFTQSRIIQKDVYRAESTSAFGGF